jgi:hypothetical protein
MLSFEGRCFQGLVDAPSNSSLNSNVNLKIKTSEGVRIGFLIHSTLEVKAHVKAFG